MNIDKNKKLFSKNIFYKNILYESYNWEGVFLAKKNNREEYK